MKSESKKKTTTPQKPRWTSPTVKHVGDVGTVIQGGGGKLSMSFADSGDPRKPQGQG